MCLVRDEVRTSSCHSEIGRPYFASLEGISWRDP